jgi:hypothetical protein
LKTCLSGRFIYGLLLSSFLLGAADRTIDARPTTPPAQHRFLDTFTRHHLGGDPLSS